MTEEELKIVDQVKPWAGPLHAMRHSMNDPRLSQVPLSGILRAACKHYKVEYPPEDIEFAILRLIAGWMLRGVPTPVEENV